MHKRCKNGDNTILRHDALLCFSTPTHSGGLSRKRVISPIRLWLASASRAIPGPIYGSWARFPFAREIGGHCRALPSTRTRRSRRFLRGLGNSSYARLREQRRAYWVWRAHRHPWLTARTASSRVRLRSGVAAVSPMAGGLVPATGVLGRRCVVVRARHDPARVECPGRSLNAEPSLGVSRDRGDDRRPRPPRLFPRLRAAADSATILLREVSRSKRKLDLCATGASVRFDYAGTGFGRIWRCRHTNPGTLVRG